MDHKDLEVGVKKKYNQVVVFTKNNARLLRIPDNEPGKYRKWKNAVINPDLSKIGRLPPHLWRLRLGEIVPMNTRQMRKRCYEVQHNRIENDLSRFEYRWYQKMIRSKKLYILALSLVCAGLCYVFAPDIRLYAKSQVIPEVLKGLEIVQEYVVKLIRVL